MVVFMAETVTPELLPDIKPVGKTEERSALEPGYLVVCWNDPVNLMEYVTHVFQTVFGWPKAKAERHMLQVHEQGKSVLVRDSLEKAEHYVHQLQKFSLHATMERD
jgi:ATP-dependent Clp protease adaptor protein ClpS